MGLSVVVVCVSPKTTWTGPSRITARPFAFDPDGSNAWCAFHGLGLVLNNKADLDGALKNFNEAIRLNPHEGYLFTNRGDARRDQGDLNGAEKDFNQAIRLEPEEGSAFRGRGRVRYEKGDMDGALRDLNEAIRLDPELAGRLQPPGFRPQSQRRTGSRCEGLRARPSASRRTKESFVNRGNVRSEIGDIDGALEDYSQAIALNVADPYVFHNRAELLEGKSMYREAADDFERYLNLGGGKNFLSRSILLDKIRDLRARR